VPTLSAPPPASSTAPVGSPGGDPADARLGLYVHVPFCEVKCTYCHFAIDPRRPDEARQERYLRAVLAEMAAAAPGPADTLYFGGGTPSLMAAGRLAQLVGVARERFRLPGGAEVTVEANPRDLDCDGYRELRAAGATRLSLGLQSFDDAVLAQMGRRHSAADGRAAVQAVREAGFANVSVDLILGWEGESPERWTSALAELRAVAPDHVSLYVLEVEGRTLLSHRARHGGLSLPDDDLVADLYRQTVDVLGAQGLARYEISNFARPGFESRHNAKYWDDVPFLGFGLSAHSYRDGRRWWNLDTYGAYCRAVETAGPAAARGGERILGPAERRAEALFTGLRRARGIDRAAFAGRYGRDPIEEFGPALSDAFAAGLIALHDGVLRLTDEGVLVSNEVFRALV
jgi:oxygen-independent coproporphyrinogen-3 oxidase